MLVIIQIVIAIIVVYLVFSIIVYVIVEWIAGVLQLRGTALTKAIVNIFEDTPYRDFGQKIFDHPQIETLKKNGRLPSYIPANNIAVALIDLVKEKANDQKEVRSPSTEGLKSDIGADVYQLYK